MRQGKGDRTFFRRLPAQRVAWIALFALLAMGAALASLRPPPSLSAFLSLFVEFTAFIVSFYAFSRWRDRRAVPLVFLFLAVAVCRGAGLLVESGVIPRGGFGAALAGAGSTVLTVTVLYALFYLYRVLSDRARLEKVDEALDKAEEQARRSEERYRTLFDTMLDAFALYEVHFDGEGRARDLLILEVNGAYERMTGRRAGDIVGRRVREIDPGIDPFWIDTFGEVARTGRSKRIERFAESFGKHLDIVVFRPREGQCAAVGRDVTERKRLEERLREAARMEAIGQLAGGIAHDFNNLLTGILGHAEVLRLEAAPGGPVSEAARSIREAAERAAELTRQLLGFARKGKYRIVPVDLHSVIRRVVSLLGRTLDGMVRVDFDLGAPSAVVRGDPGQMKQLFLDLALNARDAMPEGGVLTLRTRIVKGESPGESSKDAAGSSRGKDVPCLEITVADTGCGIPEDLRDRIFEPFFTTKEPGKGTGMGLAMVYGTVKNHGGAIEVESREGEGAAFRILLPLAEPAAGMPEGEQESPGAAVVAGEGHILLVDDEEMVRDVGALMLRRLGYRVTCAAGGKEALDLYRRKGGGIDLVLLDMVMPVMGGRECFAALKEIDPEVRVVLSTGYGIEGKARRTLDEGMLGFVQKPYCIEHLGAAVRDALIKPVFPAALFPTGS